MKRLVLFLFIVLTTPAYAQESRLETDIVQFVRGYCMEALAEHEGVDNLAVRRGVPELPPQKAAAFAKDGGRVFAFKEHNGKAVLIAHRNGACSIAARQFDSTKLWQEVDRWFDGDDRVKMIDEIKSSFAIERHYKGDFSGHVLIVMQIQNKTVENQIQGLIMVARVKE